MTNTWNRRHLILTALGALAGLLGIKGVSNVSAAEFEAAEDAIDLAEARAALAASTGDRIPIAELFIDVSQDVSAAITGLPESPWVIHVPKVTLGALPPLIISDEAEAQAFLAQMAAAIRAVAGKGT